MYAQSIVEATTPQHLGILLESGCLGEASVVKSTEVTPKKTNTKPVQRNIVG